MALHLLWMVLGGRGEFTVFVSLLAVYLLLLAVAWALEGYAAIAYLSRTGGPNAVRRFITGHVWRGKVDTRIRRLHRITGTVEQAEETRGDTTSRPSTELRGQHPVSNWVSKSSGIFWHDGRTLTADRRP